MLLEIRREMTQGPQGAGLQLVPGVPTAAGASVAVTRDGHPRVGGGTHEQVFRVLVGSGIQRLRAWRREPHDPIHVWPVGILAEQQRGVRVELSACIEIAIVASRHPAPAFTDEVPRLAHPLNECRPLDRRVGYVRNIAVEPDASIQRGFRRLAMLLEVGREPYYVLRRVESDLQDREPAEVVVAPARVTGNVKRTVT